MHTIGISWKGLNALSFIVFCGLIVAFASPAKAGCYVALYKGSKTLAWADFGYTFNPKQKGHWFKNLKGELRSHPLVKQFIARGGNLRDYKDVDRECRSFAKQALDYTQSRETPADKVTYELKGCKFTPPAVSSAADRQLVEKIRAQVTTLCGKKHTLRP